MKMIAILLILSGIATIFIPSLYSCAAYGKSVELPGGRSVPMKCLWTARAGIGLGVLLLAVGVFLFISRRLGSRRFLSVLALLLGILIILLPTLLIGVCTNPNMSCVVLMKPILIMIGAIVGLLGIAATGWNFTIPSQRE